MLHWADFIFPRETLLEISSYAINNGRYIFIMIWKPKHLKHLKQKFIFFSLKSFFWTGFSPTVPNKSFRFLPPFWSLLLSMHFQSLSLPLLNEQKVISFFAIFTKFLQKKIKKPLPCVCISRYLSLFHLSLFLSFYLSLFLCIYAERTRWSNTTKNAITRSCSEKSKLLNKMLEIRVPLTQQTSIGLFIFT